MDNRKIMIQYSRHIQNLLPERIVFETKEFDFCDTNLSIDAIKYNFSKILINYLKKCLQDEVVALPGFCNISAIIVKIEDTKKIAEKIGLTNTKTVSILQSVYVTIRSRIIYYLLEEKAKCVGYEPDSENRDSG